MQRAVGRCETVTRVVPNTFREFRTERVCYEAVLIGYDGDARYSIRVVVFKNGNRGGTAALIVLCAQAQRAFLFIGQKRRRIL